MKTSLAIALFFYVFATSAYAQDKLLQYMEHSKMGLKNEKGKILIEPQFEKLGWSNGAVPTKSSAIGYYENGWGLISTKGKRITPPSYSSLIPSHKDYIIASRKTSSTGLVQFGLIDSKGRVVLPFDYENLTYFHHDLFIGQDSTHMKSVIDDHGNLVSGIKFDELNPMDKDKYEIHQSGKIGIIDTLGKVWLNPEFKTIDKELNTTPFGQIDIRTKENMLVQSFKADSISIFSNESIAVFTNGYLALYDTHQMKRATQKNVLRIEELEYNMALYSDDGVHLISKHNNRLLPPIYDDLEPGNLGIHSTLLIATKRGELWGYIDTAGVEIVPFQFESASPFVGDIALVSDKKKQNLINTTGRRIGSIDYDTIAIQHNNTAIGKVGNRSELIDSSGAKLFEIYGDIIPHTLGYLTMTESGIYGLISEFGDIIFNAVHEKISEVINDKYMVVKTPSRLGLTLLDGTWSYWLTGDFQDMKAVTDEYIGIQRNDQWGYINYHKQLLIANRYENIRCFYNNLAAVRINGHWGFINEREKITVQPYYDEIDEFYDGYAIVKQNNLYGLINSLGELTTKIEYEQLIRLEAATDHFIALKNKKYGLINAKGLQIIPIAYMHISPEPDHHFLVTRRKLKGLINARGEYSIPLKYTRIVRTHKGNYICYL